MRAISLCNRNQFRLNTIHVPVPKTSLISILAFDYAIEIIKRNLVNTDVY
jgi:hypothetical protein